MSDNTNTLPDDTSTLSDNADITNILQFLKILLISALMATLITAAFARFNKIIPFYPYPTVQLNSFDPAVKIAKSLLTKQGGYYGPINEYFGQDFKNAIEYFQRKWGITPVDGIIGPKTWRGLALKT